MTAQEAIEICLNTLKKFGNFETAHRAYLAIATLNQQQIIDLAPGVGEEPRTLAGLRVACRSACIAIDWIKFHNHPSTRPYVQTLLEMAQEADPQKDILASELKLGCEMLLRDVEWGVADQKPVGQA